MLRQSLLTTAFLLSLGEVRAQSDHFFVTIGGGNLYKIHIQSCTTTFVGATGYGFGDIAMTPSGELYGIVGGAIYRIDTTDASTTFIGQSTAGGVSLVALTNSTLLVEYDEDLYAISTIDAATTWIGNIGWQASGDLTWYWGALYMSTGGQLIRIDSEDNFASILSVTPVGSFDPNMPVCEGLATAMIADGRSSIVGFSYPDLFCFSPLNGAYVAICQPPLPDGVPGAASIPPAETPSVGCDDHSSVAGATQNSVILLTWPSTGQLAIRIPENTRVEQWTLRDLCGRVVRSGACPTGDPWTIDLIGSAFGIYSVEMTSTRGLLIERFAYTAIQ